MTDWEADGGEHWASNAARYTTLLAPYGDIVAGAAGFAPGERVLDVGCGNGDLSLRAAAAVGGSGAVQGVDLSPAMLAVATARAAEASFDHVNFANADAATFAPDRAGFDVLVSRFGVMFFDDPTAAFSHLRSLMAPGGRLAFVCWQEVVANEWMVVPGAAVAEVLPLPDRRDPTEPGPFAFADADRVTGILDAAGFRDPAAAAVTASLWMGRDAAEVAAFLRTTGFGRAMFDDADPELQEEALARITAALAAHESPSGIALDGAAWLVTAST